MFPMHLMLETQLNDERNRVLQVSFKVEDVDVVAELLPALAFLPAEDDHVVLELGCSVTVAAGRQRVGGLRFDVVPLEVGEGDFKGRREKEGYCHRDHCR